MLRQGLRSLVDGYGHLQVAGEARNGVEVIAAVRALKPNMVVMDINMLTCPKLLGYRSSSFTPTR
jgi:YesN/AraC family two-component response regulator